MPKSDPTQALREAPTLIHISFAGPSYFLYTSKQYEFEDHPYCGPIFLGKEATR